MIWSCVFESGVNAFGAAFSLGVGEGVLVGGVFLAVGLGDFVEEVLSSKCKYMASLDSDSGVALTCPDWKAG